MRGSLQDVIDYNPHENAVDESSPSSHSVACESFHGAAGLPPPDGLEASAAAPCSATSTCGADFEMEVGATPPRLARDGFQKMITPRGSITGSKSAFYDIVCDAGVDIRYFTIFLEQAFRDGDGYATALQMRACFDASARSAEAVACAWPAFVTEFEASCG